MFSRSFVSTMDLELNLIFLKGIKFGFAKKGKSALNGNEVTVFFLKKFRHLRNTFV